MKSVNRLVSVLLIPLLLTACPKTPPHSPRPEDCVPVSASDQENLLDIVNHQSEQVSSMRALFRGTLRHGVREDTFSQVVAFQRPDKLRLEVFATGLNRLTALVVSNSGKLSALDPLERVLYQGAATKKNMERLLTVPFVPEELMLWLSGRVKPPDVRLRSKIEAFWCEKKTLAMMEFVLKDERILTFLFTIRSAEHLNRMMACMSQDTGDRAECMGNELWWLPLYSMEIRQGKKQQLIFSRFLYPLSGAEKELLPSKILYWLPQAKVSGEFRFKKGQVNPDLKDVSEVLFRAKIPKGVRVIDIDRQSQGRIKSLL